MAKKMVSTLFQDVNTSPGHFTEAPASVISARYRQRSMLLSWLLDMGSETYFYALRREDADLGTLLNGMIEGFQDFDPKFGRSVAQALQTEGMTVETLVEALVADLGKSKPKPTFIVLDNFDFLKLDEVSSAFFSQLIRTLPKGMHLILNTRLVSFHQWVGLVQEKLVAIVGDTDTLNGGIFNPNNTGPAHLEVFSLAGGRVYVNGHLIDVWDGPLPRNLFYYFVDHPMITRDEIFQTFWPDLPTKEATNVFHVTKRKISERLGYELTAYSSGFYRPSGQMVVHYDTGLFERYIERARNLSNPTPADWYKAVRLYRSPFLHQNDMSWVVKRREALRNTYAEALIGIARLYRGLSEFEYSISFYLRALREVPLREDLHRDLMSIYHQQGRKDKAVAQYRMLSEYLQKSLKLAPSKTTQHIYKQIVND